MLAFTEVGQQVLDRLFRVALPAAEPAQGRVDDDAMQPGAEPRLPLELANSLEGGQESVLNGVVGVLFIPEDAPGREQHLAAVGANARLKNIAVAGLHPRHQGCFIQVRPWTGWVGPGLP